MNVELFVCGAGVAIAEWMATHTEGCVLILYGDSVIAVPRSEAPPNHPDCLKLTSFLCQSGLTGNHWSRVGRALHSLHKMKNKHLPVKDH